MNAQRILAVLLVVVLCCAWNTAAQVEKAQQLARSMYVAVWVKKDGEASISYVRSSVASPSRCATSDEVSSRRSQKKIIVLSYEYVSEEDGSTRTCVLTSSDPRVMYHDHVHNDGTHHGGLVIQEGPVAFTVHNSATNIHVVDSNHPERASAHSLQRRFSVQDSVSLTNAHSLHSYPSAPVVGDPSDQYNLVWVSAGYDGNSRANFDADVNDYLLFLNGTNTNTGTSSAPFTPYYSVLNSFSVFIPSDEIGASVPTLGTKVSNNLACSYGYKDNSILTCDRYQAMLAASYTPVDPLNTLIIVVVNAAISGGSGGANVAVVNNQGSLKYALLMHQIAHAASDLSDEYSYGATETQNTPMLNCHWQDYNMPWQKFKDARVVPIASKPCTFENYFRPTPGNCVMAGLTASGLCPVCQFNQLLTMYDHGMQLASPTYPNKYETAYISDGSNLILYMNPIIPYLKNPTTGKNLFDVMWSCQGSNFGQQVHQVGFGTQVNGRGFQYAGPGTYSVNLTITDNTAVVLDSDRQRYQSRGRNGPTAILQQFVYTIIVSPSTTPVSCTNKQAGSFGTTYCATCKAGKVCDLSFSNNPLSTIDEPAAQLQGLQTWMIAVGIVIVAFGVLLFYGNWRFMIYHQERNPVEILPLTQNIMYVRGVLIGIQLCVLVIATFSIIYSVYQLGQLTIFGQPIMLGVIACAAVVWFGSYVGLVAAYFKNRSLLFVNFILLLLLFGCVFLFSILLVYVLQNIDDPGVQEQLLGEWNTAVSNTPDKVCLLQLYLACSGYNSSCSGYAASGVGSTNCPAGCATTNLFPNPCNSQIRGFIKDHFGAASAGGWVLTVLLLLALTMSVLLGCAIKNRRNTVHRERRVRHATGQNILEPEEIAMLRKEFDKIDIDGSGDISRDEFSRFYNSVMGTDLSPRELEEYFDRLDADGNGTLSFEEFLKVYVPHREPKRKSMVKPKNLQYVATDSDEDMQSRGVTPRVEQQQQAPPPQSARQEQYSTASSANIKPSKAAAPLPPPVAPVKSLGKSYAESGSLRGSYQEAAPSRQQQQQQRAAPPPPPAHKDDFEFDFGGSPSPTKKQQQQPQRAGAASQSKSRNYDDLDLDIDLDAEW